MKTSTKKRLMCAVALGLFAASPPPIAFSANFQVTTSAGPYSCNYLYIDDVECTCHDGRFRITVPNHTIQIVTINQENQPPLTFNVKDVTFSKLTAAVNTLSDKHAEALKVKRMPTIAIEDVPATKEELMKMIANQEKTTQKAITPPKPVIAENKPLEVGKAPMEIAGDVLKPKSNSASKEDIAKAREEIAKVQKEFEDFRKKVKEDAENAPMELPPVIVSNTPDMFANRNNSHFQRMDEERDRMFKENASNFHRLHEERANSGPVYGEGPQPFGIPGAPPINHGTPTSRY